jgi:predicted enzyme related to lactoylglutathione lyase
MIPVKEIKRACQFYEKLLDLEIVAEDLSGLLLLDISCYLTIDVTCLYAV